MAVLSCLSIVVFQAAVNGQADDGDHAKQGSASWLQQGPIYYCNGCLCFCLHVCGDLHGMLSRLQPWVLIPAAPGLDGTSADSSLPDDPYLAWFAQPQITMRSLIVVGI